MAILKGGMESAMNHYATLEKVQINNNTSPFYLLTAEKVTNQLKEHLELVK